MVKHIILPNGSKMNSLHRTVVGGSAFLLDGGIGGQNSYSSLDDYYQTTNNKPKTRGEGLADKISAKLRNLHIAPPTAKPKRKNITLSI
jgi:hypothetical protein